MSDRDLALINVNKAIKENSELIKTNQVNAVWCEVNIKAYEKRIKHQELLFNDIKTKLLKQINRAVENAKKTHDIIEELLKKKESLHLDLKKASHFGMELCEFCNKYFTPAGIKRHTTGCAMKPAIKKVAKHAKEIEEGKADLEKRKADLIKLKKKELADLQKEE